MISETPPIVFSWVSSAERRSSRVELAATARTAVSVTVVVPPIVEPAAITMFVVPAVTPSDLEASSKRPVRSVSAGAGTFRVSRAKVVITVRAFPWESKTSVELVASAWRKTPVVTDVFARRSMFPSSSPSLKIERMRVFSVPSTPTADTDRSVMVSGPVSMRNPPVASTVTSSVVLPVRVRRLDRRLLASSPSVVVGDTVRMSVAGMFTGTPGGTVL
ncbi:MAG: hypothetical protein DIKNOCCD_02023 [bacterium]|nr:hypothetical protein [bacterium]